MFLSLWLVVAIPLIIGCFLWIYAKLTCGRCDCDRGRAAGKTIIITGGNKGIGRCCVEELCKGGARIIIGCRNIKQGQQVASECAHRKYSGSVEVYYLDLQSFASVRKFVKQIEQLNTRIDVVVNNAAVPVPEQLVSTENGFEVTMQTNYLAPMLLTHLLLPYLRQPGRIVNVSSVQYQMGSNSRLRANKICSSKVPLFGSFVYGDSKLALNHWTQILSQKLRPSEITVNSCHPGYVNTEIFTSRYGNLMHYALRQLAGIYAKTPLEGAQTILHLVLSREAGHLSGKYWSDCRVVSGGHLLKNEETGKALWSLSLGQLGLQDF